MADKEGVKKLRSLLDSIGPSKIPNEGRGEILKLLTDCWEEFEGSNETEMAAYKVKRFIDLQWKPPLLELKIVRHPGTVMGSTRGDIQSWYLNFETLIANCHITGWQQLRPAARKLDVKPIVERVCAAVEAGISTALEDGIKWDEKGRVGIRPSSFISGGGPQQTITGRRKRFKTTLLSAMQMKGWTLVETKGAWLFFGKARHSQDAGSSQA